MENGKLFTRSVHKFRDVRKVDDIKLWKVNVDKFIKTRNVSIEDDVINNLTEMKRNLKQFKGYFQAELDNKVKFTSSNIHIIV